jgi:hypothetical protein
LALIASAVTFLAISGAAYAGTVSVIKKHHEANHRKLLMQAQKSPALDLASQEADLASQEAIGNNTTAIMAARSQWTGSSPSGSDCHGAFS